MSINVNCFLKIVTSLLVESEARVVVGFLQKAN